jgi:tellurite resistance protein
MALSDDDRFNLEVLRLLLLVAWADGSVDHQEADMIFGLGRSWLVPEPALRELQEDVRAGLRPAALDYALLRTRGDEALEAARAMVVADGKVRPEETALLEQVRAQLSSR